jgi:hypothetical protein
VEPCLCGPMFVVEPHPGLSAESGVVTGHHGEHRQVVSLGAGTAVRTGENGQRLDVLPMRNGPRAAGFVLSVLPRVGRSGTQEFPSTVNLPAGIEFERYCNPPNVVGSCFANVCTNT